MRSLSTRASFEILAAVLVVAALVGIIWDYARTRSQVRAQAAAITGGDPNRGEALFIEYGCGSCRRCAGRTRPSGGARRTCRPCAESNAGSEANRTERVTICSRRRLLPNPLSADSIQSQPDP